MGETVVIDVVGRVTIGHDAKLRDAINEAVADGARNVLLDMARVTKIDSSGIGELVAAHASMSKKNLRLLLVGLPPGIAAVLQATQLVGILELFEDADTALASIEPA